VPAVAPTRRGPDERVDRRQTAVATTAGPRLARLKLLVVDDEEDARTLLEEILSEYGAVVECASCVEDAIELFSRFRPDVLVSDVAMPDIDGFEFIERVRRLPPEQGGRTPAIALTAHGRSEDMQRAAAAGFEMHVTKPVDASSLVAAVVGLMEGERAASRNGVAHPS
jgi:CheY-like chemotaxis protein